MRQHIYKVPKSSIESYNGAELRLNISYDELEALRSFVKDGVPDQPISINGKHLPAKVVNLINQLAAARRPGEI